MPESLVFSIFGSLIQRFRIHCEELAEDPRSPLFGTIPFDTNPTLPHYFCIESPLSYWSDIGRVLDLYWT